MFSVLRVREAALAYVCLLSFKVSLMQPNGAAVHGSMDSSGSKAAHENICCANILLGRATPVLDFPRLVHAWFGYAPEGNDLSPVFKWSLPYSLN